MQRTALLVVAVVMHFALYGALFILKLGPSISALRANQAVSETRPEAICGAAYMPTVGRGYNLKSPCLTACTELQPFRR
jgi:hypothetical protein